MVVNIQAAVKTYKQRSEERTIRLERTEYIYKKKQTKYIYKKAKNEKAKIKTLRSNDKTYLWYELI